MTAGPAAAGGVRILRPVAVRQVSAGLAVASAVAALLSVGLSLDTTRYFSAGVEQQSITRVGTGEQVTGFRNGVGSAYVAWVAPTVVAVVLLAGAAVAALLAARSDRPGGWGAAAEQLALAAAGLLAALTGVLLVFGISDVSAHRLGEGIVTRWGPAPLALTAATVLAVAAGLTARRGRATVLATIGAGGAR